MQSTVEDKNILENGTLVNYDPLGNPLKISPNFRCIKTKKELIGQPLDLLPLETPLVIWASVNEEVEAFKGGHSIYQESPGVFQVFFSGKDDKVCQNSVILLRRWMEAVRAAVSLRENTLNDIKIEVYEDVEAEIRLCYSSYLTAESWTELFGKIDTLYIDIKKSVIDLFNGD